MRSAFRSELEFLSNFYPVEGGVEYEGDRYPCVENAFQAAKTLNPDERKPFEICGPARAKQLGRKLGLRHDWDFARVDIMKQLVRYKFQHPDLREKLIATGDEPLEEANTWHDNYWGVCTCVRCHGKKFGLNWLGRILMSVRKELQQP